MMVNLPSIDLETAESAVEDGSTALMKLFPGWARRSEANAEIAVTKSAIASIGEIKNLARAQGLNDDITDYFCRDMVRRVTRNENLDAVISFASSMVEGDANPEELVGSEWLNFFVDHSERASEEEVQRVWAAILAGEVNKPGAYSKMAMSTLSRMDSNDIKGFRTLCSFLASMPVPEALVITADKSGSSYNDGAITYAQLSDLASMGLVNMGGQHSITLSPEFGLPFISANDCIVLFKAVEEKDQVKFHPILTRVGRELSKLCTDRNYPAILGVLETKCESGNYELQFVRKSDSQLLSRDDAVGMLANVF